MIWQSKKPKFNIEKQLRFQKRRYIFEGKVLKEESILQYKASPKDSWWYDVDVEDHVIDIHDAKELVRRGIEVPTHE